jgi:hypothetical protein
MLKTQFRRALDLCKLGLQESELSILEDHYQSMGEPDFVDYLRFSNDIESVFTMHHLEKMPTVEPGVFRPPPEILLNELTEDKMQILDACLDRITDRVSFVSNMSWSTVVDGRASTSVSSEIILLCSVENRVDIRRGYFLLHAVVCLNSQFEK